MRYLLKYNQLLIVVFIVIQLGCGCRPSTPNTSSLFLHEAVISGDTNKLLAILSTGVSPNIQKERVSPLHLAAQYGDAECIKVLLDYSADVDAVGGKDGTVALSMAASRNHLQICNMLLEKGANIEKKDQFGRTPLMYASVNGHLPIVKLLVEQGADINVKSSEKAHSKKARDMAYDRGHMKLVDYIDKLLPPAPATEEPTTLE